MSWLPYLNSVGVDDSYGDGYLVRGEEHPSGATLLLKSRSAPETHWIIILNIPDQLVLKRYFRERRQAEDVFEALKVAADDLLLQVLNAPIEEQVQLIEEFAKRFS
jgi:hypothetical protein